MKKMTMLRSIATVALFTVVGMGAFGQLSTSSTSFVDPTSAPKESIDTVTVGSVMPYRVSGDVQMHQLRAIGILDFSHFTWTVPSGGTLRDKTGNSGTTPASIDTLISVNWTAVGTQSITVQEAPQVKAGGPSFSCTANTQTLNVQVVDRPTAAWGTIPTGGCGIAGTTVTIPYTITGTGQFEVTYRVTYTALNGTTSNVVAAGTKLSTLADFKTGTASLSISYNVPAGSYGKYDVYIENISDRISRKSFGSSYVATAGDFPATAATFYAYPTPATQPINHIQNL